MALPSRDTIAERKVILVKITMAIIILGVGSGFLINGIILFATNNSGIPKDAPPVNEGVPGFGGNFQANFHNDYGVLAGSILTGSFLTSIPVDNHTKVDVILPGASILTNNKGAYVPTENVTIPLVFYYRPLSNLYSYHTNETIYLKYDNPGTFNANLIINNTRNYLVPNVMKIQSYDYYDIKRNEVGSEALLYFTAGLTIMSTSPVLIQLAGLIHRYRNIQN